jgi:hypothetical protein
MIEKASDFEERLNSHPILKERFKLLFDIIEDTGGDYDKADSAELKFVDELGKTGRELMNEWASRHENVRAEAMHNIADTVCHGKKNSFGIRHSEK